VNTPLIIFQIVQYLRIYCNTVIYMMSK